MYLHCNKKINIFVLVCISHKYDPECNVQHIDTFKNIATTWRYTPMSRILNGLQDLSTDTMAFCLSGTVVDFFQEQKP